MREVMEGLEVRPDRMRENLDATGGLLLAENVTTIAAEKIGRLEAHKLVEAVSRRTFTNGSTLREEILAEPALREHLTPEEIDAALDPEQYLGSTEAFIDRALGLYHKEVSA